MKLIIIVVSSYILGSCVSSKNIEEYRNEIIVENNEVMYSSLEDNRLEIEEQNSSYEIDR